MRILLFFLFINDVFGNWRVLVENPLDSTPNKNIPFTVSFQNGTLWLENNNTWFTNSPFCAFENKSSAVSEVVCSATGFIHFGYYSADNESYIQEVRGIVVRPTHHCFRWNIEDEKTSLLSFKITLSVESLLQTDSEDKRTWTRNFFKLGESPRVLIKNFTLNGGDKEVKLSFNLTTCIWEGSAHLPAQGTMAWIVVSSSKALPDHNCFIRDTKHRLISSKHKMSMPDGGQLTVLDMLPENLVVKDPSSHHVEIVVHNSLASFQGFHSLQVSVDTDWILQAIDIKMTSSFVVILTNNGTIRKWGLAGSLKNVPHDAQADWIKMFTSRVIPKELDVRFDQLLLLNIHHKHGVFYIYDLWSDSLTNILVPICTNVPQCSIDHIEISVPLNIIRILLTLCNPTCKQVFCDYYFLEEKWAPVVDMFTNETLTSFIFFPTNSYHSVLFAQSATYRWTGEHALSLLAPFGANDLKHFVASDDVLLLQMEKEVVYISYGQVTYYKVRIFKEDLLDIDNDSGDIYSFNSERFLISKHL